MATLIDIDVQLHYLPQCGNYLTLGTGPRRHSRKRHQTPWHLLHQKLRAKADYLEDCRLPEDDFDDDMSFGHAYDIFHSVFLATSHYFPSRVLPSRAYESFQEEFQVASALLPIQQYVAYAQIDIAPQYCVIHVATTSAARAGASSIISANTTSSPFNNAVGSTPGENVFKKCLGVANVEPAIKNASLGSRVSTTVMIKGETDMRLITTTNVTNIYTRTLKVDAVNSQAMDIDLPSSPCGSRIEDILPMLVSTTSQKQTHSGRTFRTVPLYDVLDSSKTVHEIDQDSLSSFCNVMNMPF